MNLSRRSFLRGSLSALVLPRLSSLLRPGQDPVAPRRLLCLGTHLGFHPETFFPDPTDARRLPETLRPLNAHRGSFTVFSHIENPGIIGGHDDVYTLFSGVLREQASKYPNRNESLDQAAARHFAPETRYRSLLTAVGPGSSFSWDRTGTAIRPLNDPGVLFRRIFDTGGGERNSDRALMRSDRRVLDGLHSYARTLQGDLGAEDRHALDQYLSSVDQVEGELTRSLKWMRRPKPPAPEDMNPDEYDERQNTTDLESLMRLLVLALQTDSTRVGTLEIPMTFAVHELGVDTSYHKISHHAKDPAKLKDLHTVETYFTKQLAALLDQLKATPAEDGRPLLDHTLVVLAGGLGDANTHINHDLPVLVAGGGLEHEGLVSCPEEAARRVPLCNLWLSILQWLGVPAESFGTSTGRFDAMAFR